MTGDLSLGQEGLPCLDANHGGAVQHDVKGFGIGNDLHVADMMLGTLEQVAVAEDTVKDISSVNEIYSF